MPPTATPAPFCICLLTSRTWPSVADPKSEVRKGKPLMVPLTRSRLRMGQAFAGSKGTLTTTHLRGVLSGCSTPRNLFCALMTCGAATLDCRAAESGVETGVDFGAAADPL